MCYNPMLALNTGKVNTETGKMQYKFLKSLKNFLNGDDYEVREYGLPQIYEYLDPEIERHEREIGMPVMWRSRPVMLVDKDTGEVKNRAVVLPCGQCLECRLKYAAGWANRILMEAQYHEDSYFVTLTYDDEHVPVSHTEDGELVYTLNPKDLQDFIKRLRRDQEYHKDNKIRFYAVGEYGSSTHRPHYHAIIFGFKIDDLESIGRNQHGTPLHDSKTVRRLWGLGLTEVDKLTWESAAYCARYTVKKLGKSETDFYEEMGLTPEFSRMSLKPAIGRQYLDDHMEQIYENDEIFISTAQGGRKVKPPRYYDQKFDDIYPEKMAQIKCNRKEVAEKAQKTRLSQYGGTYFELLAMQEEKVKAQNRKLRRNLE